MNLSTLAHLLGATRNALVDAAMELGIVSVEAFEKANSSGPTIRERFRRQQAAKPLSSRSIHALSRFYGLHRIDPGTLRAALSRGVGGAVELEGHVEVLARVLEDPDAELPAALASLPEWRDADEEGDDSGAGPSLWRWMGAWVAILVVSLGAGVLLGAWIVPELVLTELRGLGWEFAVIGLFANLWLTTWGLVFIARASRPVPWRETCSGLIVAARSQHGYFVPDSGTQDRFVYPMVTVLYDPPSGTLLGMFGDGYHPAWERLGLDMDGSASQLEGTTTTVHFDPHEPRSSSLSKMGRLRAVRWILGVLSLALAVLINVGIGASL